MKNNGFEATQGLFDLWLQTYKGTVGKLWEVPAVGPNREKTEKSMKGYSIYAHLSAAMMDSSVDLQAVFAEAMRKTQEKAMSGNGEGAAASAKDYYEVWIEEYSETFKEFLKSSHFGSDMGELMASLMESQKFNRDMLEDNYLEPMNMPTKSDLDDVNKEIYELKKTARKAVRESKGLPSAQDVDAIAAELRSVKRLVKSDGAGRAKDAPTATQFKKMNKELDSLKDTVKKLSGQIKKLSAKK